MTGSIKGLHFRRNNSVVLNKQFPHLTLKFKTAASKTSGKPQSVLTDDALTKPPRTTKAITTFVEQPAEWNTTSNVTPLGNFEEKNKFAIFHSVSTAINKKVAVRIINTTENPYLFKKSTNCRVLRSHSWAIQIYRGSGYGIPQFDSGRWSRSDYLLEWFLQNKQTRTTKNYLLVHYT